ncbi:hypothetical protein K1T71_014050 [Dendrolimus kikuchii]|uniref:Uncharacterized protein n=1 Tax=Dendrolimus kikuchii TaxID=765133 RepID=A0ACC1CF97_9NEOP|nr:hypothetical protein K1T71_014050 [Dendrolimus kikuchii]
MKAACIILSVLIFIAILAVCVMVKFATDITVEERKRDSLSASGVYQLSKSMGVVHLSENYSYNYAERFPFVAAVTKNHAKTYSFACFASVILIKWIVTSAHCRHHGATHRVLLYYDFARNYSHTYSILFWRIHEKFNSSNPTPKFDIAVAKLNIDYYPFMIKSAVFDDQEANDVEASVWKTLSTMDRRAYLTNDFDKFYVKIVQKQRCYESYGIDLDDSLICIDLSDYEDCFVQEFGPVFAKDKVVGILAVKPRDCDTKLAIFTNVSYYTNWILKSTHTALYG